MLELLPSECWKTISAALDGSLARSDQTVVLIDNVGTVAGVEVDGHAFLKDIGSARSEKQGDEELSNAAVAPSCLDQQTLYRVGHTYRAGIDPEFSSAFVNGWFGLEACGIWSGPQAHARFAYTLNQSESVQLEIQCLGHFDEDAKSIYVSSGGEEQIISFRSKAWETKIIDINPKVFGDVCTVDMVFKCPDATSPASTGHNREDARVLGLMIASFALRPRSSRELT
jgi:hypothetical protein